MRETAATLLFSSTAAIHFSLKISEETLGLVYALKGKHNII